MHLLTYNEMNFSLIAPCGASNFLGFVTIVQLFLSNLCSQNTFDLMQYIVPVDLMDSMDPGYQVKLVDLGGPGGPCGLGGLFIPMRNEGLCT